jgi:hypothetical protein
LYLCGGLENDEIMAVVTGIQIERMQGIPIYGRVDFRKHPDMLSVFEKKGVEVRQKAIDPSNNPAITGVLPRGYVTLEEFRRETKKMIDDYCDANGVS